MYMFFLFQIFPRINRMEQQLPCMDSRKNQKVDNFVIYV
ncbi:unnamed protein product [Schistosoma curassoni]|uniref:Uncharacterized protein n=1 Tax=Schistosoma curassoni TaxID=6186 RepID=A0A183KPN2_9TREM|nr:unnamed protein product [Schistosoma curassoni]